MTYALLALGLVLLSCTKETEVNPRTRSLKVKPCLALSISASQKSSTDYGVDMDNDEEDLIMDGFSVGVTDLSRNTVYGRYYDGSMYSYSDYYYDECAVAYIDGLPIGEQLILSAHSNCGFGYTSDASCRNIRSTEIMYPPMDIHSLFPKVPLYGEEVLVSGYYWGYSFDEYHYQKMNPLMARITIGTVKVKTEGYLSRIFISNSPNWTMTGDPRGAYSAQKNSSRYCLHNSIDYDGSLHSERYVTLKEDWGRYFNAYNDDDITTCDHRTMEDEILPLYTFPTLSQYSRLVFEVMRNGTLYYYNIILPDLEADTSYGIGTVTLSSEGSLDPSCPDEITASITITPMNWGTSYNSYEEF